MANLTGYPQTAHGNTTSEDSTAQITLGTRQMDKSGNEYIYLQGTASTVAGNWVVFSETYSTKRADTDDVGPLAIAGTASVLAEYGWYQIYGYNTIASNLGAVAADAQLYLTATSGYADDADAAGEFITGASSVVASVGSAFGVWLSYPHSYNAAHD